MINYYDSEAITFSDVLLVPQYSEVGSRSDVDTSVQCGPIHMRLPVFSANMKHITGPKMVQQIAEHGGCGVLHRFLSIDDQVDEFLETTRNIIHGPAYANHKFFVSIGVNDEDRDRYYALYDAGARNFCIDIAHGHCAKMKRMIEFIRASEKDLEKIGTVKEKPVVIMSGNIATKEAALDLVSWGADIVKVGIGPGNVCQTRENTGTGFPQLSAVHDIACALDYHSPETGIIADGGIAKTGDISKAIAAGADAVMLGSMLAGTSETPGDAFENPDGQYYKVYGGSASAETKTAHGSKNQFIEGTTKTILFRGKVKYILRKIKENLQSSMSYTGAKNISEFQVKAKFVKLTNGGRSESKL